MTHILFYGIAPTAGDTAIGQSILARLNTHCPMPMQIFTTHPDIFRKLPESAGSTVHGKLPRIVPALRDPLLPVRVSRLVADLRKTGGARTLDGSTHTLLQDALDGCAGIVLQGGPNWNDRWMKTRTALDRWLFAELARFHGVPLFHVGVSCGPFSWDWPRRSWLRPLARTALSLHNALIVRDRFSADALSKLGVRTTVVASTDAAVFLKPRASAEFAEIEAMITAQDTRPRVAVCVRDFQRRYGYDEQAKMRLWKDFAGLLDRIQEKHANVFFLGTDHVEQKEKLSDLSLANRIKSMMQIPGAVVIEKSVWDAAALKHLYGLFDALVSMRLHPSILALGQGTPSLVVSYDRKCEDFLTQIGRPEWALSFEEFSPDAVVAKLQEILGDPGIRKETQHRMAMLAERHASDWDGMFAAINARAKAISPGR